MLSYSNLGYGIIDADQHWDGPEIPRDAFESRVAARFADQAPQWVLRDDGTEFISYNGGKATTGLISAADPTVGGLRQPSGTTVTERLREMDIDGIHAAVLYAVEVPINDAYAGDREATLAFIAAYNDYKVEELSAPSGHRLFTLGLMPQTEVKDAVAEMTRCVERGHKGVTISQWPAGEKPSADDDYFWAAAAEAGVPVCIHAVNKFGGPEAIARTLHAMGTADRFPELRIGLIEMGIGWIPWFMQQSDATWMTYRLSDGFKRWLARSGYSSVMMDNAVRVPSESFKRLVHCTFMYDPLGVELRHTIGVGSVMWSTDFPHGGTAWPNSRLQFDHLFANLPEDEVKAMTHDNAKRFYNLDEVS